MASQRLPPRSDGPELMSTTRSEGGWQDSLLSPASTARSMCQGTLGFQRRTVTLDAAARSWKKQEEDKANSPMARSASDPAMAGHLQKIQEELNWKAPSFRTRPGLNGEFYPHAVHNRGNMQLTHMGVLAQSIDPMKSKMYSCPLYEAPPCRFVRNAAYEGSVPRTPSTSLRWRGDEHWIKSGSQGGGHSSVNEKPFKVNHCRPSKANSLGNVSNGIIEVHPPSIYMSTKASQNGKLIQPGPGRQLG